MTRYRDYSYDQTLMLPVKLVNQLQPGMLEYTINTLVDDHIDRGRSTSGTTTMRLVPPPSVRQFC